MNKKIQDMYQGKNFIYESLSSSLNEKEATGDQKSEIQAMDAVTAVSTIVSSFLNSVINGKNETLKTERGFEEIKNKLNAITNFGAFRQYIISTMESLSSLDPAQKQAFDKSLPTLIEAFRKIENQMADEKMFMSAKENLVVKMLEDFQKDLKEREAQMKKTKPSLYADVKKEGHISERRTGDEADPAEAEFRGKAFNKSKEALDASMAFVGMIERDKYIPALKDNAEITKYEKIADGLTKKAQDLQMIDRKGLKIITPRGEVKRGDYMRDQDNLLNDIVRQKKEYSRIKNGILKNGGFTPPPVVPPVCPPGKIYDEAKGICVNVNKEETEEIKPKPKVEKKCTFPVMLNTKCGDVGKLQTKMIEILPNTVKEFLDKKGGVDEVYGKGTALVVNSIFAQIKKEARGKDGELTKEMFDDIMELTQKDVDLLSSVSESSNDTSDFMEIGDKVLEMEEVKDVTLLNFEDYLSLLEEENLDEQVFDRLNKGKGEEDKKEKEKEKEEDDDDDKESKEDKKKVKEKCIKNSLDTGTPDACLTEEEDEDEEEEKEKEEEEKKEEEEEVIEWKGLKPINDGAYTIYYDESWGDWFGDVAGGAIVAGLVTGAIILTAGAAGVPLAVGGSSLGVAGAGAAAGSAAVPIGASATSVAAGYGLGASTLTGLAGAAGAASTVAAGGLAGAGAVTIAAGAIGGSGVAKWAGNDRKPITVISFNGYMEEDASYAIARGLYNSLGGTVSSPDVLAIMSSLIMCKGTYMNNGSGKAVSVWSSVKNRFAQLAGESLSASVNDITSGGIGGWFKDWVTDMDDIPVYPRFRGKDPLSGRPVDFERAVEGLKKAIRDLDANATKLSQNLSNITMEDLELMAEAMDDVTIQVAEMTEGGEDY